MSSPGDESSWAAEETLSARRESAAEVSGQELAAEPANPDDTALKRARLQPLERVPAGGSMAAQHARGLVPPGGHVAGLALACGNVLRQAKRSLLRQVDMFNAAARVPDRVWGILVRHGCRFLLNSSFECGRGASRFRMLSWVAGLSPNLVLTRAGVCFYRGVRWAFSFWCDTHTGSARRFAPAGNDRCGLVDAIVQQRVPQERRLTHPGQRRQL